MGAHEPTKERRAMPRATRNHHLHAAVHESTLLIGVAVATALFGAACAGGNSATDHGNGGAGTAGAGAVATGGTSGSIAVGGAGTGAAGTPGSAGGDASSGGSPGASGMGGAGTAGAAGLSGGGGMGALGGGGMGASGVGGSGTAGGPDNPPPALTGTMVNGTVKVTRGTRTGALTPGFASFSFEKSHLTDGFFVPAHTALVNMFKLLGPGVVRIGADDVNTSVWTPSATFVSPGNTSHNVGTAEVDALAQFLTATQWKTIYAVNMRGPRPRKPR